MIYIFVNILDIQTFSIEFINSIVLLYGIEYIKNSKILCIII